ncbi:succinic semialdehyde dehydrogenase [Haladaptatus paucihalophilus DX253]|uniref:Succinate-semialdehyde dehydrogenase / glutarate-semialdehyde dehydrogenase n=1 Tax=Haladaptatus paucihalophilus DX253 TaxID=797209 RepID=E7QYR2_HALPU|nr:succinic semialdehyde dehydrogenase [Haladaptatus paucihalophilus]EFW90328.1 succinic semialdehyde dehydrogenase [Haladaptatus paucihalophilus DX253]SHK01329.1 succinate-semialdehyde dehydrogenase / glutarate-semialdehyde dehydrogenase [Haladaptatus paucihalophilus DX253]
MAFQASHIPPDTLGDLGRSVSAEESDDSMSVEAPFTGERIGDVPACSPRDVTAAVSRARTARTEWSSWSIERRADVLSRFHDLVLDRQAELLDVMVLESGKARRDGYEEILDVATNARYYAARAEEFLRPRRRDGAIPLATKTMEYRTPVGVVGVITPWNYPLTLAVSDAIPALLAGNTVVLKPAEETPFTALLAAKLLREAGLPEDAFRVVTGWGDEVGLALIDAVDFVNFTGSTETGRTVAERAGKNLVKCSLELGGKNPMLVLDDADVSAAVEGAIRGCFTNAGQLCLSFERLYVQDGVYDRFLPRFVERTRELSMDPSFDYDVEVGSLVSERQFEKVRNHVDDAVSKGATAVVGGNARPDVGPYFFEPTILTGVTEEMTVAREETFGPVVAVTRFSDDEDGIALANDSDRGLNASVWTTDSDRGWEIARQIDCGTVGINDPYHAIWASVDSPMGGMKDSGIGRRHGREGIRKYTESQTVAEQRFASVAPPRRVPTKWYARAMTGVMRLFKRIEEGW